MAWTKKKYHYMIPINEPDGKHGTVTVMSVYIDGHTPVQRGAILRRILRKHYGMSRHDAKIGLRAMAFDNIVT